MLASERKKTLTNIQPAKTGKFWMMKMGTRQRLLLLWVASMNATAPVPSDDEALAALRAESEGSPRTPAVFRGEGAVAAELLRATQTAVADLSLSDAAATADFAAAAAEAPAPADELCVLGFKDEEEMFDASDKMSAEWALQFIMEARTDPYQVEADAAKEQEEIAEMEATIRSGPVVFVRMWEALTTNARFGPIVDRVRQAIFLRWDLLGRIHSATGKASEPKYPHLKAGASTETSTAKRTDPRYQKVKCGKCPAFVSQKRIGEHEAKCKGSTVVDIYMYFLAILLGITRCVRLSCVCSIARSCAWLASALARSCMCVCACRNIREDDSLILFLTNFVEGCNFTPQGTVTTFYFETWLTELYKTGLIVPGAMVKHDLKTRELQSAGHKKDAVQAG